MRRPRMMVILQVVHQTFAVEVTPGVILRTRRHVTVLDAQRTRERGAVDVPILVLVTPPWGINAAGGGGGGGV